MELTVDQRRMEEEINQMILDNDLHRREDMVQLEMKYRKEMAEAARKHGLEPKALQEFVDEVIDRMVFDGGKLNDLMEPLELGWKERTEKELQLMEDLIPLLKKLSGGREIAGLGAYE